jgi:hypothetical protein
LISIINRVVPVAWKEQEAPYLEPRLDDAMVGKLILALVAALSAGVPLLVLTGHFVAQVLFFVGVGALLQVLAHFAPALSSPIDRRAARYWDGRARSHGYEPAPGYVVLPGGFGYVAIEGLRRRSDAGIEFFGYDEAARLVRHLEGARLARLRENPSAKVPPSIRLKLSLRNFGWIVVAGERAGVLPRSWSRAAPAPRGFVRWDGYGLPAIQSGDPPPLLAQADRRNDSQVSGTFSSMGPGATPR